MVGTAAAAAAAAVVAVVVVAERAAVMAEVLSVKAPPHSLRWTLVAQENAEQVKLAR